jgi:Icc-related predicted phosphoesterase
MTRLVFLSDTHNQLSQIAVPDGDILIHAGDACRLKTLEEVALFNRDMMALPHKRKLYLPGNHDPFDEEPDMALVLLDPSIIYLADRLVTIMGLRIYGMPWTPSLGAGNYNAFALPPASLEMSKVCSAIPDNLDVLVTHGPPYEILDEHPDGSRAGCTTLRRRVEMIRPRVHVFGHVHRGYGKFVDVDPDGQVPTVTFINGANCNADYEPVNPPIVIDLD